MIFCPYHERKHARPCFIQKYQRKVRRRRRIVRRLSGKAKAGALMLAAIGLGLVGAMLW